MSIPRTWKIGGMTRVSSNVSANGVGRLAPHESPPLERNWEYHESPLLPSSRDLEFRTALPPIPFTALQYGAHSSGKPFVRLQSPAIYQHVLFAHG